MKPDTIVIVVAVVTIGALVGFALSQGHDGNLLTLGVAAIAALAGVKLRDLFDGRR